jgi:hypothetical protein
MWNYTLVKIEKFCILGLREEIQTKWDKMTVGICFKMTQGKEEEKSIE